MGSVGSRRSQGKSWSSSGGDSTSAVERSTSQRVAAGTRDSRGARRMGEAASRMLRRRLAVACVSSGPVSVASVTRYEAWKCRPGFTQRRSSDTAVKRAVPSARSGIVPRRGRIPSASSRTRMCAGLTREISLPSGGWGPRGARQGAGAWISTGTSHPPAGAPCASPARGARRRAARG